MPTEGDSFQAKGEIPKKWSTGIVRSKLSRGATKRRTRKKVQLKKTVDRIQHSRDRTRGNKAVGARGKSDGSKGLGSLPISLSRTTKFGGEERIVKEKLGVLETPGALFERSICHRRGMTRASKKKRGKNVED